MEASKLGMSMLQVKAGVTVTVVGNGTTYRAGPKSSAVLIP
jgi:hypothetical protein